MKWFKKSVSVTALILAAAYLGVLGWFYLNQEALIFRPETLPSQYRFSFNIPFEEITIPTDDGNNLHGLLFEADSTKGLIFYLHGNRGALNRWGGRAELFVKNGFDTFMMDYRGYGKSTGTIYSETQFLNDVDRVYRRISARYPERPKVIVGYSLGTGPASWLARAYRPDLLILMAPFYNLPDLSSDLYPYLPGFLAKYKFANNRYLPAVDTKVVIFHGLEDRLIDINASKRLSRFFTEEDTLIVLPDQGHGGMHRNERYRREIASLLESVDSSESGPAPQNTPSSFPRSP